ncbi:MAG: hypothetical protein F6K65_02490 [Moorea sp. SIO3C2]|nr:hypothetical protein [Moorena sp. SIO3C2]
MGTELGAIALHYSLRYKGDKPDRTFGINQAINAYYSMSTPNAAAITTARNDDITAKTAAKTAAKTTYDNAKGNAKKTAKTTYDNAVAAEKQAISAAPFTDPPTNIIRLPYHQILGAAQDYYLWPDVSEMVPAAAANSASLSLRLCNYQLHDVGGGAGAGVIPIADAVNLQNTRDSVVNTHDALLANVWNPGTGTLQPRQVQVQIAVRNSNTGNAAFDNRKNTATRNTIPLVGLNQVNNADGDQRMLERTEAWFKAIRALRILREQFNALDRWQRSWWPSFTLGWKFNPAPAIQLTDDQWEFICDNAEQTGFYSVWVTVFKQYGNNLAQELVTKLNNRATADPNNFNRYHGTNIHNSVIPYIPAL